jgi:hypothetical protein
MSVLLYWKTGPSGYGKQTLARPHAQVVPDANLFCQKEAGFIAGRLP